MKFIKTATVVSITGNIYIILSEWWFLLMKNCIFLLSLVVCFRCTMYAFYNTWKAQQSDVGNHSFAEKFPYSCFRWSWYSYLNLLDIDIKQTFQYSSVWWHYSILPAKFYASFRYAKWRAVHCWSSQRKISIFAWLAWFLVSWQEQFGKELNFSWRLWLRSGLSCCVLCRHAHYFYFFLTANVCLQKPERQM